MRLEDYLHLLRRRWATLAIVTLLGLGAGTALGVIQRPQFEATAQSFLAAGSTGSIAELSEGATFTRDAVTGYARLATTDYVLSPVIDELGLNVDPATLAKRVDATGDPDTSLIDIAVTDPSADEAARIANAIADRLATAPASLTPGSSSTIPVKITRVQSALAPAVPATPNIPLDIVVGLMTGLVAGVALALIRDALDTRVHRAEEVEQVAGAALLGRILKSPAARARAIVVAADDRGARAEAFRTLRTNLRFLTFGDRSRAIVLTSSIAGEGKSTTIANLAVAVAQVEHDTVVVDADLRQPTLGAVFGLDTQVGLVDVLIGAVTLDDALQEWGQDGLRVLPAGRIPPNPSELLQSEQMVALIADLRSQFRTVLFDSPPLLPVGDATVLAKATDGAIVVAGVSRVGRSQLQRAVQTLRRAEAQVLGVVATMIPTRGTERYAYVASSRTERTPSRAPR